jgi:hypothetical protein
MLPFLPASDEEIGLTTLLCAALRVHSLSLQSAAHALHTTKFKPVKRIPSWCLQTTPKNILQIKDIKLLQTRLQPVR